MRALTSLGRVLAGLLATAFGVWGGLALFFDATRVVVLGALLALVFLLASVSLSQHERGLRVALAGWVLLAIWWLGLVPRDDRDWAPEQRVTPRVHVEGERVSIEGVRAFVWSGPDTAEERWEARSYDLRRLRGIELFVSDWGRGTSRTRS